MKKPIKVTLKDLNEVVIEIVDVAGSLDKYDKVELINIIGNFAVAQFNRGFKAGKKQKGEKI